MRSIFAYRYKLLLTSALSGTLLVVGAASAQSAPPPSPSAPAQAAASQQSGNVGQVVVTAQKRSQILKDVPLSVAVASRKDLQDFHVQNIDDLLPIIPGLSIEHSSGQQRIEIDGVSNIFGAASEVGIYINDVSVTAGSTNQLSVSANDLQRVEVLRGPQGTLYGEGSMGGTIRFVTNQPDLNKFGFGANIDAATTERGSPSEVFDPVVNIPMIDGQLGLRIAGAFEHDGGWIDDPSQGLKDINFHDTADVRTTLLWTPNDRLRVEAMVINHRDSGGDDQGFTTHDTFFAFPPLQGPPTIQSNYDLYSLTASYDLGFATFQSTTGYYDFTQNLRNFQETVPTNGPDTGPNAVPVYVVAYPIWNQYYDDVTEELRLFSHGGSPLQWDVGYFFRKFDNSDTIPLDYEGFEPGVNQIGPIPLAAFNEPDFTTSTSNSFFGNVSYKFFDRLTVGVGLRYFEDTITYDNGIDGALLGFQQGHDHALDPRIDATFALTDNVNLYANIAEGFRSGGFNNFGQPSYRPENVWRYEAGVKGSFFNNTLSAELSGFYTAYNNYVVVALVPFNGIEINAYSNAGDAEIIGSEWNFVWTPTRDWTLRWSGDYLYTRFTKINADVSNPPHIVGDPLDLVSPYKDTVSVQRNFHVWNDMPGFIQLSYSVQGPETYRIRSIGPWYHGVSDVIDLLNIRIQQKINDNLTVAIYGNNLLDNQGYLNPFRPEDVTDKQRPISFGVNAQVDF